MKLKHYSKNSHIVLRQRKFIEILGGVGDVLVFETKRKKNKSVIEGLKRFQSIIQQFFNIRKDSPEKFERLLFTDEFLNQYKENEEEAKLRLAFSPDKYLVSFSTAINQIVRIHQTAIDSQNEEISRLATDHIIWLLGHLSCEANNDLLIEQLLTNLSNITRVATEKQDSSMYGASIHWYINIVFNEFVQSELNFDLSYLNLFDRYFFSSVKFIILRNQTSLFKALVSSLVDGVNVFSYYSGKVWDYGHLLLDSEIEKYSQPNDAYGIEKQLNELTNSENDLYTKENLDNWLKKFEGLKKILQDNLTGVKKEEAKKIEREIRKFAVSKFKYNNLLEIVFAIAAFCLFKQKAEYIKYLWEYKQPGDSSATWSGLDIVPNRLDDLIIFYFRKAPIDTKFLFWEDHHGSEFYFKKYFLILLARFLQGIPPDAQGRYEQIENYSLHKLHVYRLSDIEYSVDGFIEIAKRLKEESEILRTLGFDLIRIDETFDKKLIPFLRMLKGKAKERIKILEADQPVSSVKVAEFKDEVLKGFNEGGRVRNILKHYNLYEDKTNDAYSGELERFGINVVDDKALFFEDWHVHYLNRGLHYGSELARGEDSRIVETIAECCKPFYNTNLESILENVTNLQNAFILATNVSLYEIFSNSKGFKPKWYKDSPQLEVRGFGGWYVYKNQHIPIFKIHQTWLGNRIMVLKKSMLGRLVQYSPLNEGDKKELRKDIFFIHILVFSEDGGLMKKFLEIPPDWLKKIGEESEQREHLRKKVLINIYERFEFIKHKEFEGFLLYVGNK
jgi:hypothetical protein